MIINASIFNWRPDCSPSSFSLRPVVGGKGNVDSFCPPPWLSAPLPVTTYANSNYAMGGKTGRKVSGIVVWLLALCSPPLADDWHLLFLRFSFLGPPSCSPSGSLPLVGLHLGSSCAGLESSSVFSQTWFTSSPWKTSVHPLLQEIKCAAHSLLSFTLLSLPSEPFTSPVPYYSKQTKNWL